MRTKASVAAVVVLAGWAPSCPAQDSLFVPFAAFGQSYSAAVFADHPLVGRHVDAARVLLVVIVAPGSDAADFFTDIALPTAPDAGATGTIILRGSDLGWSGSGTFTYDATTTAYNGTIVARRYGAETPPNGNCVEAYVTTVSAVELIVPPPGTVAALALGAAALRRRR
jgi:uncharacterized protein (TIGR03382 family)